VSRRRAVHRFALIAVSTVLPSVAVVTLILRITLTVTMIRAARTIPVTSALAVIVSVTIPTFVLTRRVIAGAATRRRRTSTTGRASTSTTSTTTFTITTGLKPPGGRRRSAGPFDFEDIITTDALVVHLVVGIISITSVLVLNESEQTAGRRPGGRNVAAN
jgi:hypothetical protein